jgi:ATPase subunit of ABC transporter with duplicated ATPase domains
LSREGDYETYVNTVKETRLAQHRAYDAQQKEIAHILEFINKHDERPKIVAQKAELAMSVKESEFAGGHGGHASSLSSFFHHGRTSAILVRLYLTFTFEVRGVN